MHITHPRKKALLALGHWKQGVPVLMFQLFCFPSLLLWIKSISQMPFRRNSPHCSQELISHPQPLVFIKKTMYSVLFFCLDNLKHNYTCSSLALHLQMRSYGLFGVAPRAPCHFPFYLLGDFPAFIVPLHACVPKPLSLLLLLFFFF